MYVDVSPLQFAEAEKEWEALCCNHGEHFLRLDHLVQFIENGDIFENPDNRGSNCLARNDQKYSQKVVNSVANEFQPESMAKLFLESTYGDESNDFRIRMKIIDANQRSRGLLTGVRKGNISAEDLRNSYISVLVVGEEKAQEINNALNMCATPTRKQLVKDQNRYYGYILANFLRPRITDSKYWSRFERVITSLTPFIYYLALNPKRQQMTFSRSKSVNEERGVYDIPIEDRHGFPVIYSDRNKAKKYNNSSPDALPPIATQCWDDILDAFARYDDLCELLHSVEGGETVLYKKISKSNPFFEMFVEDTVNGVLDWKVSTAAMVENIRTRSEIVECIAGLVTGSKSQTAKFHSEILLALRRHVPKKRIKQIENQKDQRAGNELNANDIDNSSITETVPESMTEELAEVKTPGFAPDLFDSILPVGD